MTTTFVTTVPRPPADTARPSIRRLSGYGVLAECGDLVLLYDDTDGPRRSGADALVNALVGAAAASQSRGRQLSRRLARLLGTAAPGDFPALCAFGPTDDGLAVVVQGTAELVVTAGGQQVRLDGRDAVTLVDRVVAGRVESIRATIGDGSTHPDYPRPAIELPVPPAGPLPQPCDREPPGARVVGVYCKRAHFTDPAVAYCTVCGISMMQATRLPVSGDRPQLGVLMLDDGTMYPLATDHVVGRMPEADEVVAAGRACAVRLKDPLVSRVHAKVVLDGWEVGVVDAGSTNGTFLCAPEQASWTRLPPGAVAALRPGSVVAFGRRQLRYHSYRSG